MISQDIIHYRGIAFTRFGEEGGPLCAGGELMPLKRGGNTHTQYIYSLGKVTSYGGEHRKHGGKWGKRRVGY